MPFLLVFLYRLYEIGQPQHPSTKMQFPSYIIDTFNLYAKSFITTSYSSDFHKIVMFYKYLLCVKGIKQYYKTFFFLFPCLFKYRHKLFSLSDLLCLTSEQYMVMCNILSISWIFEEVSWFFDLLFCMCLKYSLFKIVCSVNYLLCNYCFIFHLFQILCIF